MGNSTSFFFVSVSLLTCVFLFKLIGFSFFKKGFSFIDFLESLMAIVALYGFILENNQKQALEQERFKREELSGLFSNTNYFVNLSAMMDTSHQTKEMGHLSDLIQKHSYEATRRPDFTFFGFEMRELNNVAKRCDCGVAVLKSATEHAETIVEQINTEKMKAELNQFQKTAAQYYPWIAVAVVIFSFAQKRISRPSYE